MPPFTVLYFQKWPAPTLALALTLILTLALALTLIGFQKTLILIQKIGPCILGMLKC